MWTIKKIFFEFVKILLVLSFVFFFCHEASGTLIPQPGSNPYSLQWKTGVLITGPPGEFLKWQILIPGLPPSPPPPHQPEEHLIVVWLFIPEQPHRLLGFEFPEEHRKTSPNPVTLDLEGHGVRGWQIQGLLLLPKFRIWWFLRAGRMLFVWSPHVTSVVADATTRTLALELDMQFIRPL